MRQLHLVGLTDDGQQLVLAPTAGGRGGYLLPVDARLQRVLAGEDPEGAPREATLSPKEIQARLRGGASVAEVARLSGLPITRVERFAWPVISEREQILTDVRAGYLSRPRLGRSRLPLGEAVTAALAHSGSRELDPTWSVVRRPDGLWVVRLDVVVRNRARHAEWTYHAPSRVVRALDAAAAAMGYAEPVASAARKSAPRSHAATPAAPAGSGRPAGSGKPAGSTAASPPVVPTDPGRARGVRPVPEAAARSRSRARRPG